MSILEPSSGELPPIPKPEVRTVKTSEVKTPEVKPLGQTEQAMVTRIDKDGDPDKVLQDIANVGNKPDSPREDVQSPRPTLNLFETEEVQGGVKVTLPGGISEEGVIATRSQTFRTKEDAMQAIETAKARINPQAEYISLQRSFSSFHSIKMESDGKYSVTFPAFRSLDNPGLLVGTGRKTFDSWDQASNFYLETRNRREYPEEAVFQLKVDDLDYRFYHLNKFGEKLHLADKQLEVPGKMKAVLDFDTRNTPDPESAHTYYKTLEIPGWQSQVFRFVENFTQTPEGQQLVGQLNIKDLKLLTPQQAAKLTLEVVTRLKKYNLDEMNSTMGQTESDQNNALVLLQRGLQNRDNTDFKGNGVCRNFASTVKVVFEGLKTNQTKFNYLQDTYAFYESGPRADFDPAYEIPKGAANEGVSLRVNKDKVGHAWNSFVTVEANGISQAVVDATWSNFDYDTQESVKLDYTLQRMEKDIYRNLKRKDAQVDSDQAAQFYLFLIDSLPQQEGLILDVEATTRARASNLYKSQADYLKTQYAGLSPEQYDKYALDIYKKVVDTQNVQTKTQFYLGRAMEVIQGREKTVSEATATEVTRLMAETKQEVSYFDVVTVYNLPTQRVEDRSVVVSKYVKAWEDASGKGYVPIRNLVFGNKEIQEVVLQACSPQTKQQLATELGLSI